MASHPMKRPPMANPAKARAAWEEFEDEPTRVDLAGLPAQEVFGHYRLVDNVYRHFPEASLACRQSPGEPRAVALLRARGDLEVTTGLSPQALLQRHLRHPNIIEVLDFVRDEDELLVVVEYVVGESLSRLQARGNRLPIPISVAVAVGALNALQVAHASTAPGGLPLVYGSITPESILINEHGIAQLIDPGLVEVSDPSCLSGSPGYVAPEHVFDHQVDMRSDLFTVGLCLWESLTGRRLLQGSSFVDGMLQYIAEGSCPASRINPQVSAALDRVLAKAVDPAPARRFQSAAEFSQALQAAARVANSAEIARYLEGVAWSSLDEQRGHRRSMLRAEADELQSVPEMARSEIVTRGEHMPQEADEPTRRVLPSARTAQVTLVEPPEDVTVRVLPRVAALARLSFATSPGGTPTPERARPALVQAPLIEVAPRSDWNSTGANEITAVDAAPPPPAPLPRRAPVPYRGDDPVLEIVDTGPGPGGFGVLTSPRVPHEFELRAPAPQRATERPSRVSTRPTASLGSRIAGWTGVVLLLLAAAMTGRYAERNYGVSSKVAGFFGIVSPAAKRAATPAAEQGPRLTRPVTPSAAVPKAPSQSVDATPAVPVTAPSELPLLAEDAPRAPVAPRKLERPRWKAKAKRKAPPAPAAEAVPAPVATPVEPPPVVLEEE